MNAQSASETAEDEIRAHEDARYEAVLAADADAFAALAHPALSYMHSSAAADSLESYTQALRDGAVVYQSIDHPVDRIVIDGDTAMVLGEMHAEVLVGGQPRSVHSKVIAVWLRRDGRWVLLAVHATAIPQS